MGHKHILKTNGGIFSCGLRGGLLSLGLKGEYKDKIPSQQS